VKDNFVSQERLAELLDYDPETGLFVWRPRKGPAKRFNGKIAGAAHTKGYVRIVIDQKNYFAHRLAWFYVHGVWPPEDVDHINGVRNDNRIANLRLASRSENLANKVCGSDRRGVCWHKKAKKWAVSVKAARKSHHIGLFDDLEEAVKAAARARENIHGEFANHC